MSLLGAATTQGLWWLSVVCVAIGLFGAACGPPRTRRRASSGGTGPATRCRSSGSSGQNVSSGRRAVSSALGQLAALFLLLVIRALVEIPFWWVLGILILIVPPLQIEMLRKKRVEDLEKQLDSFLLSLANALEVDAQHRLGVPVDRARPSGPDPAGRSRLAIKEMKVGSTTGPGPSSTWPRAWGAGS